ncbi:hypothetical protein [Deinococcus sp.]|uniref:hypothetical protein n=1 Tax=Deinococcus sp. TaxID=47478 RepID=UPI003CC65998
MRPLLPIAAALLLAACAPTLQGVGGRIVNVKTGQEGQLNFIGGFQERPTLPTDPDNVTVTLGDTVYSGRYTVLGRPLGAGLTLSYGDSYPSAQGPFWYGGSFGTAGASLSAPRDATRPANLIAKTSAAKGVPAQTLTCSFQVDDQNHGIGTCQDSAEASYSLQF